MNLLLLVISLIMKHSKLLEYELTTKLGQGSYGSVYKAKHKPTQR